MSLFKLQHSSDEQMTLFPTSLTNIEAPVAICLSFLYIPLSQKSPTSLLILILFCLVLEDEVSLFCSKLFWILVSVTHLLMPFLVPWLLYFNFFLLYLPISLLLHLFLTNMLYIPILKSILCLHLCFHLATVYLSYSSFKIQLLHLTLVL